MAAICPSISGKFPTLWHFPLRFRLFRSWYLMVHWFLAYSRHGNSLQTNSVCHLIALSTCESQWKWSTAYYPFHFLSKSLVYQSICKRVDGRIEHDGRVSNGNCRGSELVGRKILQEVQHWVCSPAYSKDCTDSDNHQGDSLPHLHHTLHKQKHHFKLLACFLAGREAYLREQNIKLVSVAW